MIPISGILGQLMNMGNVLTLQVDDDDSDNGSYIALDMDKDDKTSSDNFVVNTDFDPSNSESEDRPDYGKETLTQEELEMCTPVVKV